VARKNRRSYKAPRIVGCFDSGLGAVIARYIVVDGHLVTHAAAPGDLTESVALTILRMVRGSRCP